MAGCNCYVSIDGLKPTNTIEIGDLNGDGAPEVLEVYNPPLKTQDPAATETKTCFCGNMPPSITTGVIRFTDPEHPGKFLTANPATLSGHNVGDNFIHENQVYKISTLDATYDGQEHRIIMSGAITRTNDDGSIDLRSIFLGELPVGSK